MTTAHPGTLPCTTTLTITNPGETPIQINTSSAALVDQEPTALASATMTWERAAPRDHDGPGQLTLRLRHTEPALIHEDARLHLTVTVPGHDPITLGAWWVAEVVWTYLRPGAWEYTLSAVDATGYATGLRLASTPWPAQQELEERLAFIQASSPVPILDLDAQTAILGGPWLVSPPLRGVDVDNAPALDVIHATANTFGLLCTTTGNGIVLYPPAANRVVVPRAQSGGTSRGGIERAPIQPVEIPASAIGQTPRSRSRRSKLTRVGVGYWIHTVDTGEIREVTRWYNTPGAHGRATSQVTIQTDWLATETSDYPLPPGNAWLGDPGDRAAGIAAEGSSTVPLLEPTRILLDRIPTLWPQLIEVTRRAQTTLVITDCPSDIATTVDITRTTITITGGRLALAVELQPSVLAGVRPMRWSDWPNTTPAVPVMGDPIAARFSHLAPHDGEPISATDLILVAGPSAWKA